MLPPLKPLMPENVINGVISDGGFRIIQVVAGVYIVVQLIQVLLR